ncbi:protein FAM187B [Pseudophryne corroboree]|uniref:protein FAM187B n=1 Tax=Pseudophryne corroboree TaxID=495146 RepID=UPI003081D502
MTQELHTIFMVILVLEITSVRGGADITLQCPAHRPCRTAFASYNPVILKCQDRPKNTLISWQYLDVYQPHAQAVTFIQSNGSVPQNNEQEQLKALDLMSRSKLVSGDLQMLSPRVEDTGVYTCKDGEKHLAYYEVDFQDVKHIYISHASLRQRVQPNTTVDLGNEGTMKIFTVWTDWQPCDRCQGLGERKKVGFCYAEMTKDSVVSEGSTPCGLLRSTLRQVPFLHPPELRIEMCRRPCAAIPSMDKEIPYLHLDNYLTYLHADALFKCPTASIYRPVYWEHGKKSFTRLLQLTKKMSYVLDGTTGGGVLSITLLNKSDEGVYRCYVDGVETGRFQVTFPDTRDTAVQQSYSLVDYLLIGLFVFVVFLIFFSIFLVCLTRHD